ncbi:MAG: hypothetical protein ABFC67_08585 [Mizugakiibacter sp.]|uniref:hypothetical protein n=1 Tax=Mizugakiibacter sp. TaxID=1972610 RepID=UPI0031C830D4|nr:hypothetical protein [Xanthomonadaceae bacterium]
MSQDDPEQKQDALPPSTVPSCQLSFRGLSDNHEWNERFIRNFQDVLFTCGRYMDLSLLDGVTAGFDYDDALASVDLGYESTVARQYTNEGGLLGVAKVLRVKREGGIKVHAVFDAKVVGALAGEEICWPAVNIVAHELAHVTVIGWFQAHSPGVMLAPHKGDWAVATMREVAHTIWEEYAACRLCAPLTQGDAVLAIYADSTELAVDGAMDKAREAIKAYRTHGEIDRLLVETTGRVANPLKMAAYLMGHADGQETDFDAEDRLPATRASEFWPLLPDLLTALRAAWESRHAWNGLEGEDGIVRVVQDALARAGAIVTLQQEPPGSRVDVPFSAATMPNGEADMAVIRMLEPWRPG